MAEDLIALVLNHWGFWTVLLTGIIVWGVIRFNSTRLKPEQKPDFGVRYRAERVKKHLDKREKCFAIKPKKAFLFRDVFKIGKILSIELIPSNPKNLYSMVYRRFGFYNWLITKIGFGKNRIVVDDQNIERVFDDDKKAVDYIINNNIYFRERGGLMILSGKAQARFVDEINADADYENAKGFVSDFPRRLSNLHPSHAIHGDTLELENSLEERSEDRKRFIWGGKK